MPLQRIGATTSSSRTTALERSAGLKRQLQQKCLILSTAECLRSLFVKQSSLIWVPCVCRFPYVNQLCYQICAADSLSKE